DGSVAGAGWGVRGRGSARMGVGSGGGGCSRGGVGGRDPAGGSVGGGQGGRRRQVEAAFHAFEALQEGAGGVVGAGQQHAGADELQDQARVGGAAHGGQALVGDVGQAGQGGRAEAQGLAGHPFELVGGDVQQ